MDQLRPLRAEQPQTAAAHCAEMPFGGAAVGAFFAWVFHLRVVDRDVLATLYLERRRVAAEVDRVTAAALGFAADRAVAALIRVGMGAGQTERDRAAVAGAFEVHDGGLRLAGMVRVSLEELW